MSSSTHHPINHQKTCGETITPGNQCAPPAARASSMNAALYVVATPIGNLDDIGARALRVLREADLVACEDTRKSKPMLRAFGIDAKCIAFHAHNEASMTERLLERVRDGQRIALISDAGTPAISDPGARLVQAALIAGLKVTPIPGPCAVTTLASAAGIVSGKFLFEGFLPTRRRQRIDRIEALDAHEVAFIVFEAPHRIEECATDLLAALGPGRTVVVGRELTKVFEQVERMALGELPGWLAADPNRRRGEFVLAVLARGAGSAAGAAGAGQNAGQAAQPGTSVDAGRDAEGHARGKVEGDEKTDADADADSLASGALEPSAAGRKAMKILCESMPPRQAAKLAARISGDRADALYAFRVAQRPTA